MVANTLSQFFSSEPRQEGQPGPVQKLLTTLFKGPVQDDHEPSQFAAWLPHLAYDEESQLFILKEGIGYCLELMPQSGADATMAEILQAMFASFPDKASIQIHLFGTPKIETKLLAYANQRVRDTDALDQSRDFGRVARNNNVYRVFARKRVGFLMQSAYRSIVSGIHYTLRDFRVVISATIPAKQDDISKRAELLALRDGMLATLKAASFPSVIWDADALINWCADFANPHRMFGDRPKLVYDDGREIRDQIVDWDTSQVAGATGLIFSKPDQPDNRIEARFCSVKSYPKRFALWQMGALCGDLMQSTLQYPCPFLLTLGVQIQAPEATRTWVTGNQLRATQNASSKMAPYMPEFVDKKQDWDEAARVIDAGDRIVSLYHELGLFTRPELSRTAEETARAIWRARGFEINNDTYNHRQSLLASLPMTLSPSLHRDMKRTRRVSTKSSENAIAMSPLIGEWRGSPTPVLIYGGRRGQLITLDFYDNEAGNRNAALIGTPGSGKSSTLLEIMYSYLGVGAKVWALDLGKSFERLCDKVDGQFIELYSGCGLNINPFPYVVDLSDDMGMLQGVIAKMANPFGSLDPYQFQQIANVITRCWNEHGKATTITHIQQVLMTGRVFEGDKSDRRILDMGAMLAPYAEGGVYAEFFHGEAAIDFDNQMIVIEVEWLKNKSKAMHRVALMILLYRITSMMYFTRNNKKLLVIDELKQQLGDDDDPVVTMIVEEAARRARKYGGSLITATHSVEDYQASPALQTAFKFSDFVYVMRQTADSVELLFREGRLSLDEAKKRLLQSLRMEKGAFTEAYVFTPFGEGVVRVILDPYTQIMFSNRHEDNGPLDEKKARGLTVDEAIGELLRERGIECP